MRLPRFFVSLLLIGCSCYAIAQSFIVGRIIDEESGKPVAFCAIRITGTGASLGVITNIEGDFQIPGSYYAASDSLVLSCIGYKTKTISLRDLTADRINTITIKQTTYTLQEVVIENRHIGRVTGRKAVRYALENLSRNYPESPVSYQAYYRDYQREDEEYVNLNEAIIIVRDAGFQTNDYDSTQISLLQYHKSDRFRYDSATTGAYGSPTDGKYIPGASLFSSGGNELAILRIHDPIRNSKSFAFSFIDRMEQDFVPNHSFQLDRIIDFNNTRLYQISFQALQSQTQGYSAWGKIFIEVNNFAIHKIAYSVLKGRRPLFSVTVEYARRGDKMYLNYLSFNNFFRARNPGDFIIKDISLDRLMGAVVLTFNNEPDEQSFLEKGNCSVSFKGKDVRIKHIHVAPHLRQSTIFLDSPELMQTKAEDIQEFLKIEFRRTKDVKGRMLNDVSFVGANQFREIFLQKILDDTIRQNLVIDKKKPLGNAMFSPSTDSTYWMNTPLRK